jgi:hypothetical protein
MVGVGTEEEEEEEDDEEEDDEEEAIGMLRCTWQTGVFIDWLFMI